MLVFWVLPLSWVRWRSCLGWEWLHKDWSVWFAQWAITVEMQVQWFSFFGENWKIIIWVTLSFLILLDSIQLQQVSSQSNWIYIQNKIYFLQLNSFHPKTNSAMLLWKQKQWSPCACVKVLYTCLVKQNNHPLYELVPNNWKEIKDLFQKTNNVCLHGTVQLFLFIFCLQL